MNSDKKNQIEKKKRALSFIQPTGIPTLGNYLGAMKGWVDIQNSGKYESIFAVCDLHSITVRQKPTDLKRHIYEMFALLMAIGLDPERSTLFVQSHVPEHTQLAWIISCNTQFGELSRMTQFKDKAETNSDNINLGLFAYPSLMAADILLYQADFVPVGEDQKQHIELTRDAAERFNNVVSKIFTIPEPMILKTAARVRSLQDPTKKMSKSDENINGTISLKDDADTIRRKFKRAVTDNEAIVRYAEGKDGINNLLEIYSAITGKAFDEIEKEFDGKGYGDFKKAVADVVVEELAPIQKRFDELMTDKKGLEELMKSGAEKAGRIAIPTLKKVMKKTGFVVL